MSIVTVADPERSSPSRLTVLNPASEKVTVYGPGLQVHDPVLAVGGSDDRTRFFNQRRAGRLDRHTREHGTRGILDHARNGGLRPRRRGNQHDQSEGEQPANGGLFSHGHSPVRHLSDDRPAGCTLGAEGLEVLTSR